MRIERSLGFAGTPPRTGQRVRKPEDYHTGPRVRRGGGRPRSYSIRDSHAEEMPVRDGVRDKARQAEHVFDWHVAVHRCAE